MREVLKTNNPVLLNFAQVLLADAGIDAQVFDVHTSVIEGSLGILPRRIMVPDAQVGRAETVLREGLAAAEPVRSDDRFLDGRITVRQPETGFRSGLDAVMLAAAVPARIPAIRFSNSDPAPAWQASASPRASRIARSWAWRSMPR